MNLQIKLIILGEQYVGKTTLVKRLTNNNYRDFYMATIGVDYDRLTFTDDEENEHEIILWDTSGQDKFNFLLNSYFDTVNSAIIMYDVTNRRSYSQACKWIDEFRYRKKNDNIPIIVLANKIDSKEKIFDIKDLEKIKKDYDVNVLEISIKENTNLENLFPIIVTDFKEKILTKKLDLKEDKINIISKKRNSLTIQEEEVEQPRCCNLM